MECSLSIYHILFELPDVLLPIDKEKCSQTLLKVLLKLSLKSVPVILELIKVLIVEPVLEITWLLIVDLSVAIESVSFPLSFVGKLAAWVVELSVAVHCSEFPFSLIDSAICVGELAVAVSKSILFFTIVN